MRTRKRIALLSASVVAAALIFAAMASATAYNTNLRLNRYSLGFFYGVVKSSQPKCKVRKVALYVKDSGPPITLQPVGGTKSAPNGHWDLVDGYGLGGEFYAKVNEKRITINGHSHTCKADWSNVLIR